MFEDLQNYFYMAVGNRPNGRHLHLNHSAFNFGGLDLSISDPSLFGVYFTA